MAAEGREFDGIRKRMGNAKQLVWQGARFACEAQWQGDRWWMLANGPGEELVLEALKEKKDVDGMISTGLCGALDPALRLGDVVVSGNAHIDSRAQFARGAVHSIDHVAVTAAEKRTLRNQTGAVAVDMESAAVERKGRRNGMFHTYVFARCRTGRETRCHWTSIAIATRAEISRGCGLRSRPSHGPSQ